MNEAIAKGMTLGGGGTAFIFGLDANLFISLCGLLVAVGGLGLTWYYKRKQAARDLEWHIKRMGQSD